MAYVVPVDAIRTIISTLSGVPESRVNWDGEPERSVGLWGASGAAGKITLDVLSRASNGEPEMRIIDNVEVIGANRILTISCRADNFLQLGEAFDLLEKVRLGFMRRSIRKAFRDAGLAYLDAVLITPIEYNVDTRAVSSAVLDIRLAQTVTDAPPQDGDPLDKTEFIEKASRKSAEDIPDFDAEPVVYLPFREPD